MIGVFTFWVFLAVSPHQPGVISIMVNGFYFTEAECHAAGNIEPQDIKWTCTRVELPEPTP